MRGTATRVLREQAVIRIARSGQRVDHGSCGLAGQHATRSNLRVTCKVIALSPMSHQRRLSTLPQRQPVSAGIGKFQFSKDVAAAAFYAGSNDPMTALQSVDVDN